MTVEEHLMMALGQLTWASCLKQAQIDELKAKLDEKEKEDGGSSEGS